MFLKEKNKVIGVKLGKECSGSSIEQGQPAC